MERQSISRRDLYYTADHEWIDFQGAIAYVGISAFKLTGFKDIHQLIFHDLHGFVKMGETIATIVYNDYVIEARMPVDGKFLQANEAMTGNNASIMLRQPETAGWLVKISPAQPYERKGLLIQKDYQLNGKSKFAKS